MIISNSGDILLDKMLKNIFRASSFARKSIDVTLPRYFDAGILSVQASLRIICYCSSLACSIEHKLTLVMYGFNDSTGAKVPK